MFKSLHIRLLTFMLPLSVVPLVGISFFAYFQAKDQITKDRITLYLEQIAQDTADKIDLTLWEKREEGLSMSLNSDILGAVTRGDGAAQDLVDQWILVHEVYDLIVLLDSRGNIRVISSADRNNGRPLPSATRREVLGTHIGGYYPDRAWLEQALSGNFAILDWHTSKLVRKFYRYENQDKARHYSLGFAVPVKDRGGLVAGVILNLMNWEFIQRILDNVEQDFESKNIGSGYAFLFGGDHNTVIAHKYRTNRTYHSPEETTPQDNYGTRLIETHKLPNLRRAVIQGDKNHDYYYPAGVHKIAGLARIENETLGWTCGVGINDSDIFRPVQRLKFGLLGATIATAMLVLALNYVVSRSIKTPLKKLTASAQILAAGDFSQRVDSRARDEIGTLAQAFNEMARSLEERSTALIELNRDLETKVNERTHELQQSNRELGKAYRELQEAQSQLIQSEKLASLGQLVAGIAHEIKNPLNFIYGNTEFLRRYVSGLRALLEAYELASSLSEQDHQRIREVKERINFDFLVQDLDTLVANFEEGARRINTIIADLRAFSRMDSETFAEIDLHDAVEVALSLLRNEYRDRIHIHREYQKVPKVECYSGKISQVLMNILSNACQAIEAEGDIWIRSSASNGRVHLEIRDSGSGIDPKHLHRIFEPFFTTKDVGRGTGLGLSISYGIIRQHGGDISVQSEPGKGTAFTVTLPVKQSQLVTHETT